MHINLPGPAATGAFLRSVVYISQDPASLTWVSGGTIQVRPGDSPGPLTWQLPFMWQLPFQPDHGIPLLSHHRLSLAANPETLHGAMKCA